MATQTETYKLNKPDRTDNVNIEELNENFDKIDKALSDVRPYIVTITANEDGTFTADKGFTEIVAAIENGNPVQARIANGEDYDQLQLAAIERSTNSVWFEFANHIGLFADTYTVDMYQLVEDEGWVEHWKFSPSYLPNVGEAYNGNELRVIGGRWRDYQSTPTAVSVVKDSAANTVTVTSTYRYNDFIVSDQFESVSVINLDENGNPVSVTTDGVTCTLSWEGFEL